MDDRRDKADDVAAAAMGEKLDEMKNILDQYVMIQRNDDQTVQGNSGQTASGDFVCLELQEVTEITEEPARGDKLSCESTTLENRGSSSDPQNGSEVETVQKDSGRNGRESIPKSETFDLVSKETQNGTVPNAAKREGTAVRGILNNEGSQTSNYERLPDESKVFETGEVIDTMRNLNAVSEDDQRSASDFKSGTERSISSNSGKEAEACTGDEVNATSVGNEIPKSQNPALESKGSEVGMLADAQAGQSTTVGEDDQPISTSPNFLDGAGGNISSRKTEGRFENCAVDEVNTNSVGNQTSTSLISAMMDSKSTQTEGTLQDNAVDDDGQESRPQFQGGDQLNGSKKENYQEIKRPIHQAKVPSRFETQTTQTEESSQSVRNTHPRTTEGECDKTCCMGAQYSVSSHQEMIYVAETSTPEITRGRYVEGITSSPKIETVQEVTVDNVSETVTFQTSPKEDTNQLNKLLAKAEIEEMLRKIRLENPRFNPFTPEHIASTNLEGRASAKKSYNDIHCGGVCAEPAASGEMASGSGSLVNYASAYCAAFQQDPKQEGASSTTGCKLRTLEDSLIAFDLYPRLLQLEDSLEQVRRHQRTPKEHEADCRSFDKELQALSRKYHPDSVTRRGGTEEEITRAKDLQTALNATRTVLNTLNKMFLEDIDIEHKYQFFTKLDIGTLGNEDEVENHAYQVLFKISLVSEIKQESVVGETRRFLEAGRRCLDSYVKHDVADFMRHRGSAFFHLKRCVTGYRKLHAELEEVETECREEKLQNISPLIHRMKRDCWKQLRHLEGLLELSKRPAGERFMMQSPAQPLDEYFVLPFDCYVTVIMTCSMMINKVEDKGILKSLFDLISQDVNSVRNPPPTYGRNQSPVLQENFHGFQNPRARFFPGKTRSSNVHASSGVGGDGNDAISLLYKLASYYAGDKRYKTFVTGLLQSVSITKEDVKGQFLVRLVEVRDDLEVRFKICDYEEKGTKKYIVKELKLCREMKAEFEAKKKEVVSCIKEINKNSQSMKERLDKLLRDNEKVSSELKGNLSDVKLIREEIENYSRKKLAN